MKKILAVLFVLIIVFSAALIYNVYTDESGKEETGYSNGVTSDDVMSEIDDSLLDEDDTVEIGEMV